MIDERFVERVKEFEGIDVKKRVYDDSGGFSFGWGTNLTYIPDEWYLDIAEFALRYVIDRVESELRKVAPEYNTLPEPVRFALLDMAYNMGVKRLMNFSRMWECLRKGDYEGAANEVLSSRYAKQVPRRARSNAELIRKGKGER